MYLPKVERNRYTYGKVLRKSKALRKADPNGKVKEMPPELQEYVNQLIDNGLTIKNLSFAQFKTKNGLPYPGLIAVQPIASNTILVKVPVDCLLTTRCAFMSDIQKMFIQNPKFFAKRFTSDWQDNMLLAFLLYQYQRGKQSQWYNLIRNLPRQIDYAIFWKENQMDMLEDQYMKFGINKQKQRINQMIKQFQKICSKYPEFYKTQTLSYENIVWIHTHLVTRCFGKYFQYTTMVPFAELFNHECTDVYYTMGYHPGNPHDTHQEFYEQQTLTQQQMNQADTTNGTYDADDYILDDQQFDILSAKIKKIGNEAHLQQFEQDILKDIRSIKSYLTTFISFNDSVSLKFLIDTYRQLDKVKLLQTVAMQKKRLQQIHTKNVQYLSQVKSFYARIGKSTYSYGIKQKKKIKKLQNSDDDIDPDQTYFEKNWPKDKFDQFIMLCSTKDQYQKGAQVYFCYGRLPNKLLLLRYGISLEYNKYDHIFIRINVEQQLLKAFNMHQTLEEISMSKIKRFKVKRTKFCLQLLTYYRISLWNYEEKAEEMFNVGNLNRQLQALSLFIDCLKEKLAAFTCSAEENEKKLTDPKYGYHQYFAIIYKLQQQRILLTQISQAKYAIAIIQRLKNSKGQQNIKDLLLKQLDPEKLTFQTMMQKYFETFR